MKSVLRFIFMDDPLFDSISESYRKLPACKTDILNLITNSIKYNRKNGSVDCFLKEEKESDERVLVDVTIKEYGNRNVRGFPEEYISAICSG